MDKSRGFRRPVYGEKVGFSSNLCALMENSGTSSYKLSKAIGVHITTITNWRDGRPPKVEHLISVAKYFGVSIDDMLSDSPILKKSNKKD